MFKRLRLPDNYISAEIRYARMMDLRRLDWTLLRSFLAVIDTGSLLGAARRLGTYQPTLSRQIAELESQLGASLFERTGRGLVPTAAGLAIVDAARDMASSVERLGATLTGRLEAASGSVRVSCSQVAATYLMPSVLASLRKNHPEIQIDLSATNQVSNLLGREADIALRLVRPTQSSLIARKLADMPMGAYATKGYLGRRGTPAKVQDLLSHDLVGLDADESLLRGLQDAGLDITRESFAVRCDDQVAGVALVRAGAGIGFLPRYVARTIGGLVPLLPALPMPSFPVWLVVHREVRGSATVRCVFDHLAAIVPTALAEPE